MLTKEYDLKQNEAIILNEDLNQQFWTSLVLTIQGFIKMETIRFCLFVCLRFIVPLENFSLIWRRHYYR